MEGALGFFFPRSEAEESGSAGLEWAPSGICFSVTQLSSHKREFMAVGGGEDDVTEEERKRPTENGKDSHSQLEQSRHRLF